MVLNSTLKIVIYILSFVYLTFERYGHVGGQRNRSHHQRGWRTVSLFSPCRSSSTSTTTAVVVLVVVVIAIAVDVEAVSFVSSCSCGLVLVSVLF